MADQDEDNNAIKFLRATKAEVAPWEPLEGNIVTGILLRANEDTGDGVIFTEECLRDLAQQANNLTFKDGALMIHGPIKDGKIAIDPKESHDNTGESATDIDGGTRD